MAPTDAWGFSTTFSVLRDRGRWLQVIAASYLEGGPGSLDDKPVWVSRLAVRVSSTRYSIAISLGAHRLWLNRGGHAIASWTVGVGAPWSPTPTGRFEVVEKIPGPRLGAAYGCCVIGLSVMQHHGPLAGGQVAIHGTNWPASIGANVSNGCVHGYARMLHELDARVPLGAPVTIRR